VNPFDLLSDVIEDMTTIIQQEHLDNHGRPTEVGRKGAAYRACYSALMMALADRAKIEVK